MSFLQAPKAPSDTLRREAWRILARLDLIIEFRPWLDHIKHTKHTVVANSPFVLLWETFALGASLATLLNLLGSAPPRDLTIDAAFSAEKDLKTEFGLGLPHREKYFTNFIQRVQLLELQQQIPFGEVLRVQDLFGGTNSGFAKVLKTVSRVLTAIQERFPGLFVLPPHAAQEREEYMQELVDSESAHVAALRMTGDSAELLSEEMAHPLNPCLECLIVSRPLLRQYHDRVLALLEGAVLTPLKENWDQIFAFEDETRKNAVGAYRSICANYLGLADVLQGYLDGSQPLLASYAQILLTNVSVLLTRTAAYSSLVDKILSLTSPADSPTYDALCTASFRLAETSTNLNEMGLLVRTLRASRILQQRAFSWQKGVDPAELGPLLLGDVLGVAVSNSAHSNLGMHGTQQYAVFLFEMMLLCCAEVGVPVQAGDGEEGGEDGDGYPLPAWSLGPCATADDTAQSCACDPDAATQAAPHSFELDWTDDSNAHNTRTLEFYTTCTEQYDQWCEALEAFVPACLCASTPRLPAPPTSATSSTAGILSEDEDAGGRRRSHCALLEPQGGWASDQESLLSPNLLPRFFGGSQDVSPLAINTTFPRVAHLGTAVNEALGGFEVPPTPPPDSEPYVEADPATLLDLTGQVRREGGYAQAHGGFADVWKGVWDRQPDRWVAVKVLRSRLDDPQREAKMHKRLAHEVSVWKRLDHKHVLKLLGTVSDFGPYDSMVCPWLEQGSVSKYMERRGDILSMTDRLQLLCEVADGLNYLHENSIVHGDLTGSNILIDDDHRARPMLTFGLSSIVVEFCGTTGLTSLSSSEDDLDEGGEIEGAKQPEETEPVITTRSDIYSFGSVTLEILSGRIPYHYLRQDAQVVIELHKGNKPRRPAVSFVTDAQWSFIQHCWASDPLQRPDAAEVIRAVGALHRASLEFRRHTY
ncbi:TKL/TKL-ccin protein kinase [Mycena metata]|uniref:TKL/TKL-ccin protein kinase n=1 Tax=Mycena metata TaxID=1033252 RepID=A0AAD7H9L1_9AGAR|nr:TKL/TKL-ccin protein kinase [Mycena metata]